MSFRRLLPILLLAVVVASCSEDPVESTDGGNEFDLTIETEEGSLSIGADATLPDELEIAVPDGGEVVSTLVTEGLVLATVRYPIARWDEIVGFYHAWTQDTGDAWEVGESEFTQDGQTQRGVWWTAATRSIMLSDCYFAPGTTDTYDAVCVSLSDGYG